VVIRIIVTKLTIWKVDKRPLRVVDRQRDKHVEWKSYLAKPDWLVRNHAANYVKKA
jgi:hypothetical protein